MSESDTAGRRPRAFRLAPTGAEASTGDRPDDTPFRPGRAAEVELLPAPDPFAADAQPKASVTVPLPESGGSWLGRLFWSALGGLVSLAVGLWAWKLVEELFALHPAFGWVAFALAGLTLLAFLAIIVREGLALRRMGRIAELRAEAGIAVLTDDGTAARSIVRRLSALTGSDPRFAAARGEIAPHLDSIIDGRALIGLAERAFLASRDREAKAAIAQASERVSVVTAISPRAIVDILFVAAQSVMLTRRIAAIYGGRPGAAGFLRIGRRILSHLALTGGLAITDSVLSQLVGQGLAARLSAKLGEGVLNGLLTARVGLAAIAACRPLPFVDLPEPKLQDVAGEVLSGRFARNGEPPPARRPENSAG